MAEIRPTEGALLRVLRHPLTLLILGTVMLMGGFIATDLIGMFTRHTAPALGEIARYAWPFVALGLYWLFVRYVEGREPLELGSLGMGREWGIGVFTGFVAISITILAMAVAGAYHITGFNSASVLLKYYTTVIGAGIWEELLFRGIMFRLIERWLGSIVALVISGLLFGLVHLGNDHASMTAAIGIAIEAGIMLGAIYMITRRLWAAIGLHMAWNFTQGAIYGAPVSGFNDGGIIRASFSGPEWLTGGGFGPEASLPAMLICTTIGIGLLYSAWRQGKFIAPSIARFTGREPIGPYGV